MSNEVCANCMTTFPPNEANLARKLPIISNTAIHRHQHNRHWMIRTFGKMVEHLHVRM